MVYKVEWNEKKPIMIVCTQLVSKTDVYNPRYICTSGIHEQLLPIQHW